MSLIRNAVALRVWPSSTSIFSPAANWRATRYSVFAAPSRTHIVMTITDPDLHSKRTFWIDRFTTISRASDFSVAATSATTCQSAQAAVAPSASTAAIAIHVFILGLLFGPARAEPHLFRTIACPARPINPPGALLRWPPAPALGHNSPP